MTPSLNPKDAATKLADWFRGIRDSFDRTIQATGSDEPHRKAAALSSVNQHARLFRDASDPGRRIREATYVLAGATRTLDLEPLSAEQWHAAINNVQSLSAELRALPTTSWLREDADTIFHDQFIESLQQAGVTGTPTILNKQNRKRALGLAVNWGMRYSVAAAMLRAPEIQDPAAEQLVAILSR